MIPQACHMASLSRLRLVMALTHNPLFVSSLQRRRTISTEQQQQHVVAAPTNPLPLSNPLVCNNTLLLKQWLHTYTRIWLYGGIVWPIAFVLWQVLFQRVIDVACGWVYPELAVRPHVARPAATTMILKHHHPTGHQR